MRRRARVVILVLVGALLAGCGLLLSVFVIGRGRTPAIAGERAVSELLRVPLGGVEQCVLVRGQDRTRPVLLFLHGGPGMPAMYLAHAFQREWEREFVVVHWDRRGAGKSYAALAPGETLSVSQTLADTLELTRWLCARFAQPRILLVGHSWGSYLGLLAARAEPGLYTAFVGTGQLAGSREEADARRRELAAMAARALGDPERGARIERGAEVVGEDAQFELGGQLLGARSFWPILRTGLFAPEYTLGDALHVKPGAERVAQAMQLDLEPRPLEGEIERLDVPVYSFLGRHDLNAPSPLAAEYLARLEAPLREVVWFEHSAHFPFFEEPARFLAELVRVHAAASAR